MIQHILNRQARTTQTIMTQVMLALLPGTVVMISWLGPGIAINLIVVVCTSVVCELIMLRLRGRPALSGLTDGSIVLAAWLLALCLPPTLPIMQLVIGASAMTILGKHVYGGLGQNLFNPAMVGYALLLISFPQTMTHWLNPEALAELRLPSSIATWWQVKWHPANMITEWDSITQATPLDRLRTAVRLQQTYDATLVATSLWWKINLCWLLGGLYLLWRGVIRWHIPLAMLATLLVLHGVYHTVYPNISLPIGWAMTSGGVLLGAFFIATDPVTAPSSRIARLCFGVGIGVLTFVLRTGSNYPEGVAFAVLLMNATVPLLDRLFSTDKTL